MACDGKGSANPLNDIRVVGQSQSLFQQLDGTVPVLADTSVGYDAPGDRHRDDVPHFPDHIFGHAFLRETRHHGFSPLEYSLSSIGSVSRVAIDILDGLRAEVPDRLDLVLDRLLTGNAVQNADVLLDPLDDLGYVPKRLLEQVGNPLRRLQHVVMVVKVYTEAADSAGHLLAEVMPSALCAGNHLDGFGHDGPVADDLLEPTQQRANHSGVNQRAKVSRQAGKTARFFSSPSGCFLTLFKTV